MPSRFLYLINKSFDKRVLKHVAKCSKQYKHIVEENQHIWSSLKRHIANKRGGFGADMTTKGVVLFPFKDNEEFDELIYKESQLTDHVLRKRHYSFRDNNMELKRLKVDLASQKAMFLLMLKTVCNGQITHDFLDAIELALCMASERGLWLATIAAARSQIFEDKAMFSIKHKLITEVLIYLVERASTMNRDTQAPQTPRHKLMK
ncbi:hypothetical protein Cgig2_016081 [Carnegiea gigantea]|uniref:F-box domain-containing protein n=1 Tax=Carnegiea gigantea TaxID=171969 RepID=A0A9Q1GRF9_9CARY|nr:hypothetical protein Cgig2_016081 [Carnegiea gigantea]